MLFADVVGYSRLSEDQTANFVTQFWGSGAFAAVTAAYGVGDLSLSYVGRMPLAKNYGAFEIYHVDQARPAAG